MTQTRQHEHAKYLPVAVLTFISKQHRHHQINNNYNV